MKRILLTLAAATAFVLAFQSCKKDEPKVPEKISVTGVSLDKDDLTLTEGEDAQLICTVTPNNAEDKKVTWQSSSEAVASVDQNGKVSAVKAGSATITVKTNDGGKTATCAVTVKEKTVLAMHYERKPAAAAIAYQMGADPSNFLRFQIYNQTKETYVNSSAFTVTSSNEAVLKKEKAEGENYIFKAVGPGESIVTIENAGQTFTCTVTVKDYNLELRYKEAAAGATLTYELGSATDDILNFQIYDLENKAYVDPSHFTVKSSSAIVIKPLSHDAKNYSLKALAAGTANVTFLCYGQTFTCTVTVTVKEYDLELRYNEAAVTAAVTYQRTITSDDILNFQIYDLENKAYVDPSHFTVTSSEPDVVKPLSHDTKNYSLQAYLPGAANVTFECYGQTFVCTVIVKVPVYTYTLIDEYGEANSTYQLMKGPELVFQPKREPAYLVRCWNPNDMTITNSNPAVVKTEIFYAGDYYLYKVTGVAAGTAEVTFSYTDRYGNKLLKTITFTVLENCILYGGKKYTVLDASITAKSQGDGTYYYNILLFDKKVIGYYNNGFSYHTDAKTVLVSGNLFYGASKTSIPAGTYAYTGKGNAFNIGTGGMMSTNYSADNHNWQFFYGDYRDRCIVTKLPGTDQYDITISGPTASGHFKGKVFFVEQK